MNGYGILLAACGIIVLFVVFLIWEWSVRDANRRADRLDDRLSWWQIAGRWDT